MVAQGGDEGFELGEGGEAEVGGGVFGIYSFFACMSLGERYNRLRGLLS